jgi:type I restriction enzyme R subunit
MGYQYYNANQQDERNNITEVVLKDRLSASIKKLNPWINDNNLNKAYTELTSVTGASLMEINEKVWKLIKGATLTVKQVIEEEDTFLPVRYIDYENPNNNDYLVVNQMKYHGKDQNSIPDLIIYINGLPIGVIECKSPITQNSWDKAYSDLVYYQKNSEKLFHYNQICAGIWDVNGKYGAIGYPPQFYSVFKTSEEDEDIINQAKKEQDKLLLALFRKDRVLDIIRHFVLFELEEGVTVKKLPRYQQIRACNKTIERLQSGEGGVVWHTQGSGKSLTMAYVTRKLQAPEYGFDNPTVMIMTDRKDLDRQITKTFQNVGFKNVNQASSVAPLDKLLRNDYGGIITTTLQKFQETDKEAMESSDQTEQEEQGNVMIEKQIQKNILTKITKELVKGKWVEIAREEVHLEELSKKQNLYILVDEAHRSHYGFLASFMRTVLTNAKFVDFT